MLKVLGETNLAVGSIGQGTGFDFSKKVSTYKLVNLIRKGVDLGLNFIDTAESYGEGLSEEIVGRAIHGIRKKAFIATKFAPEHSSYKDTLKVCDESLRRLGVDVIDLYQFHWPNPKVPLSETLGALEYLRRVGKIRYIGLANFLKKEIVESKKLLKHTKIISLQAEYNLFERAIEQNGILTYCGKNKISIIAYSPLDQGRISTFNNRQKQIINRLCKKYQKTSVQIALAWLVSHKDVIAIPRTTNAAHLAENAQVMSISLLQNEIAAVDKAFLAKLLYVPIDRIRVSLRGDKNSKVFYKTIDEAILNKLGFVPSPLELSGEIRKVGLLKPIRLVRNLKNKDYDYDLIGGRSRYWAWRIAYGYRRPIPAYFRENY